MPAKNPTDRLVERLCKALDPGLISVIWYGAAAGGDYHARFSDINVLCVLREIGPAEMGAAEPIFRWWQGQGNPAPLLLTEHELRTSTDCFAIEFHDMQRRHQVLYGPDLIPGLEIDNAFYRAQVEQELRSKLLRLRQKASAVLSDRDVLRRLLIDSLSSFCVLMRHALILEGGDGGGGKRDVIERAAARFGVAAKPFLTLLDLREERVKLREVEPGPLLSEYLAEIGKVIDVVDGLEKNVPGKSGELKS